MAWAEPNYPKNQVDSAGFRLTGAKALGMNYSQCLEIINNWRSAHSYPLNSFQMTLRGRARREDKHAIIAQRIKRLESIQNKLTRQKSMQLSQMQDIGGCRAVVETYAQVSDLAQTYTNGSLAHEMVGKGKNYITDPKVDGYRSIHLIFRYSGAGDYKIYSGLKIEIQLRTLLQHAWATAVEAVGIFTKQALKSNQGSGNWLRFFALASSGIALIEKTPAVPGTPDDQAELIAELRELNEILKVQDQLKFFQTFLRNQDRIGIADAKYYLLKLDFSENMIHVSGYPRSKSQQANDDYIKAEAEAEAESRPNYQVVLVSVDSIAALKRAYPNYFLDTEQFSNILSNLLK